MVLPLAPAANQGKIKQLTQLARRCTFGVGHFLAVAWEQNVSARGALEKFRHEVQRATGLSSGLTQACRDRASTLVKAWEATRDKWHRKIVRLETQVQKLEERKTKLQQQLQALSARAIKTRAKKEKTLENTMAKLSGKQAQAARLRTRAPRFPQIQRRQPIWFDSRIGSFSDARQTTGFHYWITISTLQKGRKLVLPVQVYPHAECLLRDPSWQRKSFSIVWDQRHKRYAVHLKLEKRIIVDRVHEAWGTDLGLKRLVYAINDTTHETIVLEKDDPVIWPLLSRLKSLENRIARLQRLGKTQTLQKFRRKRYLVAEHLRNVVANHTVRQLPVESVLFSIGQPTKIREAKGARQKNSVNGTMSPKKQRKRLHRWSFKAQGEKLYTKALENGHLPFLVTEWWTTRTCYHCGSRDVSISDRQLTCNECGSEEDRDANGGLNISELGKQQLVKLRQQQPKKKKEHPLNAVVCDFPPPVLTKTGKRTEKTGGRPRRPSSSRKADVNRPRTCDEPAPVSGGSTKSSTPEMCPSGVEATHL